MNVPLGFRFSGVQAGLKPMRRDLALVVSDVPAACAGRFTVNQAAAAPILDVRPRVPSAAVRAVVVNSGNANALTGAAGLADVAAIRAAVSGALDVAPDAVLTASTGIIGVRMPAEKVVDAVPRLVAALGQAPEPASEAILTTDTRTKLASRTIVLGGHDVTLSAIAKGSGMIAPQLATMIAVITTDAAIAPALLDRALGSAMAASFHCLVVDGDMSTNDAVFALANGRAGNPRIADPGADYDAFSEALTSLCIELARDIASDGEGATRLLEAHVTGAPSVDMARDLARSIAASSLVKAAMFGADPNWGRILATVGARCGSQHYPIDPYKASVKIQGVTLFASGEPVAGDSNALRLKMRAPEVRIEVALGDGTSSAAAWGCDLGYDYVKINADYSSVIVQTPDGALAKDERLTNFSPTFKRTLLVEALSYIARFAGTRCVVRYGGAAMLRPALQQSFCDDIKLLRSCGLHPIVVHDGGSELGAHLVTLLNLDGGHAIGVSGNDGGLIRAKHRSDQHGEIATVDGAMLEMFLGQGYVPVVSTSAIGDHGQSAIVDADQAASAIAIALRARKLIYLTDAAGVIENGELVTQLSATDLSARFRSPLERAISSALQAGVERVHVIDGRAPHSVIAELFTDGGVGTLVMP